MQKLKGKIELLPQQVFNEFQIKLHNLLCSFLSGGYPNRIVRLLYPISDGNNIEIFQKYFKDIQRILFQLGEDEKCQNIFSYTRYNLKDIAFIISELYEIYDKIAQKYQNFTIRKVIRCKNRFHPKIYKNKDAIYFEPVILLWKYINRYLKDSLLGFFLHGSVSTLDFIKGYSDLDTLLILKKEVIKNHKKLLVFRKQLINSLRYLFLFDPFQHHEHFIYSEYEMFYYPQMLFPLILFEYSTSLFETDKELFFNERDCDIECLKILENRVRYFSGQVERNCPPKNLYDMKFFLSTIMLMPTLYLQANGCLVYKKYSFEMAKKDFTDETWDIVEQVSKIREGWSYRNTFPNWKKICRFYPNPYFIKMPDLKLNNKIPIWIYDILRKSYQKDAYTLAYEMYQKTLVRRSPIYGL